MGIADTLQNITDGISNFFTGKRSDKYAWLPGFESFLNSAETVYGLQSNWNVNLGYSFMVCSEDGGIAVPFSPNGTGGGVLGSFGIDNIIGDTPYSEFKLNINPSNISFREPFSTDIIPTQTGVVTQHSGSVLKDMIISGTTGINPKRGAGGLVPSGSIGALIPGNSAANPQDNSTVSMGGVKSGTSILGGEPSGFYHFHMFRNYIRSYVQLKTDPSYLKARLVFNNRKDGESWIVEPMAFDMLRDAKSPILYNYTIILKVLKKVTVSSSKDDLHGAWNTFLNGLRKIENVINTATELINTGAGIITQGADYLAQLEQSVETTLFGPIIAVGNVLGAVSSGVNRVSALPRKFYNDLQSTINQISNRIYDVSNSGSSSYNDRYGRTNTAPNAPANRKLTLNEISLLQGLNYVNRGLTMVLATNLPFGTNSSNPTVTSLNTSSALAAIVAASNPMLKLNIATIQGLNSAFGGNLNLSVPNSAVSITIHKNDTLENIALRNLGDVSRWYELAVLNGLKYPYLEEVGSKNRGTLSFGDKIYVPSTTQLLPTGVIKGRLTPITQGLSEIEKSLGVDIALTDSEDLKVNSQNDLALVVGASNAAQALHIAMALEKGSLKYHPIKGVGLSPGSSDPNAVSVTVDSIRNSILSDNRFSKVSNLSVSRLGTKIALNMRVLVSNIGKEIPIQVSK